MNVSTFLSVAALAVCASGVVYDLALAQSNPITINQCFITEPKPMSKKAGGTQIDYVNHSTKTATKVIFGVGYRNAEERFYRKVTDIGNFAPGQPVQHHFSLFNDVTFAGKKPASCSAILVTFNDGTQWVKH